MADDDRQSLHNGGYGCVIVMAAVVGLMIFYSLVLVFT
jgi:hypothetical protein